MDFFLGFISATMLLTGVWLCTARSQKSVFVIKDKVGDYRVTEAESSKAQKPDNEKARHYNSAEYRAERKYVEGRKKAH